MGLQLARECDKALTIPIMNALMPIIGAHQKSTIDTHNRTMHKQSLPTTILQEDNKIL